MHTSSTVTMRTAALALAFALLPAAARAQSRKTAPRAAAAPSALLDRWELGAGLGLAIPFESQLDTGFKLAASGFYGLVPLSAGVVAQVGGSFGYTYNSWGSGLDGSLHTIDLLPTGRLRASLAPLVFGYLDVGVGLGVVRSSYTSPAFPGLPATTFSSTDASFLLKLGGGLGYDLQPNLSLTFEPAFHIYAKSGSITQFTLMVGALYRP